MILHKYKNDIAKEVHSDILKLISVSEKPIMGVSPDEAKDELERRVMKYSKTDVAAANIHSLPLDILIYISKSATSVAGIQPRQAVNEIIRRYLAVDDENLTFKSMLLALKHSQSQENTEKWAANEDVEEMEEFIKNASEDNDVAAFAYGIRHLKTDDKENAKNKIKKFADHINNTNDPNDQENYKELIEAIDDLK